jgi:large subunit ribosomal protein L29
MKTTELRDTDDNALIDHIATARRDLFGLRMQHATGELDNTARLRTVKRDLARALTVARERGVDPYVTTQIRDDRAASSVTKADEAENG